MNVLIVSHVFQIDCINFLGIIKSVKNHDFTVSSKITDYPFSLLNCIGDEISPE